MMLEAIGYLLVFVAVAGFLGVTVAAFSEDFVLGFISMFGASIGFGLFVLLPGLALGPGAFSDYATLTRDGYLVRASVQGVVYKTCEMQIVTGFGGDAASLAYDFSAPAEFCATTLPAMNKQVRVEAHCWAVLPVRLGSSDCIVDKLTMAEIK